MAMMYGMHVFEICYHVELWLIITSKYLGHFWQILLKSHTYTKFNISHITYPSNL